MIWKIRWYAYLEIQREKKNFINFHIDIEDNLFLFDLSLCQWTALCQCRIGNHFSPNPIYLLWSHVVAVALPMSMQPCQPSNDHINMFRMSPERCRHDSNAHIQTIQMNARANSKIAIWSLHWHRHSQRAKINKIKWFCVLFQILWKLAVILLMLSLLMLASAIVDDLESSTICCNIRHIIALLCAILCYYCYYQYYIIYVRIVCTSVWPVI